MTKEQLIKLSNDLRPYDYVVQRNWFNLPNSIEVDGHGDLDLFCSDADKEAVLAIVGDNPLIDVRSPSDDYYPQKINEVMLVGKREYGGFKTPSHMAHFLSLYYHNAVHKKDNPYGLILKTLFLKQYRPIRCKDEGVGFYV